MYDGVKYYVRFQSKSVVNLNFKFRFSENLEFLQSVH
jgi:hypothetical protein